MPRAMTLEEEFFQRTQGIRPNLAEDKLTGFRYCFTGKLDSMTRDVARHFVVRGGGSWTTSVTNATQILVAGSIPRTAIISGELSLKLQKARRLGIQIVSEETFLQILKDRGLRE